MGVGPHLDGGTQSRLDVLLDHRRVLAKERCVHQLVLVALVELVAVLRGERADARVEILVHHQRLELRQYLVERVVG